MGVGSTTKPVYFNSGVTAECGLYAGGTRINLNGDSKSSKDATVYAPTDSGISG